MRVFLLLTAGFLMNSFLVGCQSNEEESDQVLYEGDSDHWEASIFVELLEETDEHFEKATITLTYPGDYEDVESYSFFIERPWSDSAFGSPQEVLEEEEVSVELFNHRFYHAYEYDYDVAIDMEWKDEFDSYAEKVIMEVVE
ncbi:hypothetical protein [Virgibacillus kimchii]